MALQDRKNLLNRELNNAKIRDVARKLDQALSGNNYARAGLFANELLALDSEHPAAKEALSTSLSRLEDQAQRQRSSSPREAVKTYDAIVRISNTAHFRSERDKMRRTLQDFDTQFAQLKSNLGGTYDDVDRRIRGFLEKFSNFSSDEVYVEAQALQDRVKSDQEKMAKVLEWESKAEMDASLTYEQIINSLKGNSSFSFDFAKQPVARLIAKYENLIVNYTGGVTLVLKGAKNLPDANDIGNKAPEAYCELEVAGSKFTTEVLKDERNPKWNMTCAFKANGSPLVFRVFDDNKFGKAQLLGALQIPQMPRSGKDQIFNSPDGWSIILDVRRDR